MPALRALVRSALAERRAAGRGRTGQSRYNGRVKRRAFFSALRAAPLIAAPALAEPPKKTVLYQDRGYLCCALCGCPLLCERSAADPGNYNEGAIRCGREECPNSRVYAAFPSIECEVLPDFQPVQWP